MAKKYEQDISSLLDDEISHKRQARLIKEMSQSEALRKKCQHYNLISEALQDKLPEVDVDVSKIVQEIINNEAPPKKMMFSSFFTFVILPIVLMLVLVLIWPYLF